MKMKESLKKLINVAAGRVPADVVIKNCKVVNVFSGEIEEGNIAICDGQIAGIGEYEGLEVIDAEGRYAAPGFIDSHIHIQGGFSCHNEEESDVFLDEKMPQIFNENVLPYGITTIKDLDAPKHFIYKLLYIKEYAFNVIRALKIKASRVFRRARCSCILRHCRAYCFNC